MTRSSTITPSVWLHALQIDLSKYLILQATDFVTQQLSLATKAQSGKLLGRIQSLAPCSLHAPMTAGNKNSFIDPSVWLSLRNSSLILSMAFHLCLLSVMIHRETTPNTWSVVHAHKFHESSVNSISWAPHDYGLILACASSDGRISVLEYMGDNW